MLSPVALLIALLAASGSVQADIFKCRQTNGAVEISNIPCPVGSTAVTRRADEPVSAESRKQAEQDLERMRSFVEKRDARHQAEEAEARQIRSEAPNAVSAPRQYGDPEACLRELNMQALEATQRAALEAECRSRIKPPETTTPVIVQPVYGRYPPPAPLLPGHMPSPPPPGKPAAPTTTFCPPSKAGCR